MRYNIFKDPFADKQPKIDFSELLTTPVHSECPACFGERDKRDDEISVNKLSLSFDFPDPNGLLETAYNDFKAFMHSCGIENTSAGVPLKTVYSETECKEAHEIDVSDSGIYIYSADTEGVRRALVYIEDEMKRRGGAFLGIGKIKRKPFIKKRISRCFFSPPSHASSEGKINELASDIDYYPDEYLNRLAHDGINGLWIGANFFDILPSKIITEYGADSARRLEKLRSITEKCEKYGIGIYLFSVEPQSGRENPIFEKYPEYHGGKGWGNYHMFCPSTEGCQKYIEESVTLLFTEVPKLAGFLDITTGEQLSGCGSAIWFNCERCKKKFGSHAKTLAATEKMLHDAVRNVAPNAEFISWTYSQRVWSEEDFEESLEVRDPSVIHMQNFEDMGFVNQLGKERLGLDYWLSYVGPGKIMRRSIDVNKRRGIRTYAKIQACNSHEVATVPYVPVPGILYDKYKIMKDEGIEGAVLCWYFGNYPCMMNKASSELSFEPFFSTKEEFLKHLAGIYWGKDSDSAVKAYEAFERGYSNYPVSNTFEWFGPMQDSPAVPLHLDPVDVPMPSTWLVTEMVGGDRLGECLGDGHTVEEAVELSEIMSRECAEGARIINSIPDFCKYERQEQQSVCSALSILFESGKNILRFYELRRLLGIGKGDPADLLSRMKDIVLCEMENSKKLIPLCENDIRLGYHSEANGYKFFAQKLRWRIEELEKLLDTEFAEVKDRIEKGLAPLKFYAGECETRVIKEGEKAAFFKVDTKSNDSSMTSITVSEENGRITLVFEMKDAEEDTLEVRPEYRMFFPSAKFVLGEGRLDMPVDISLSFFGERAKERRVAFEFSYTNSSDGTVAYKVSFDRAKLGMEPHEPFRLDVERKGKHHEVLSLPDRLYTRLIHGTNYSPESYAMIVL